MISEMIHKIDNSVDIIINDKYSEGNYDKYIQLKYAKIVHKNISISCNDYYISTHHRHDVEKRGKVKFNGTPIFFDNEGFIYTMIYFGFYPTFSPTKLLQDEFDNLNLPTSYDVVHFKIDHRNKFRTKNEFYKKYTKIFNNGIPIITTDEAFDGTIDVKNVHGMLKLYILIKSRNVYTYQTGFTAMASLYRKRQNTFLIDTDMVCQKHMCPPIIAYSNVNFTSASVFCVNYYDLHRSNNIENYYNHCLCGESNNNGSNNNMIFPFFSFPKNNNVDKNNYKLKLYHKIENCPVPDDLKTELLDIQI